MPMIHCLHCITFNKHIQTHTVQTEILLLPTGKVFRFQHLFPKPHSQLVNAIQSPKTHSNTHE